jgi:hypothetical protein
MGKMRNEYFYVEDIKGGDHSEDTSIDVIILKTI